MSNSLSYFSILSPVHLKAVELTGKSSMEGEKRIEMEMGGGKIGKLLKEERDKLSVRWLCVWHTARICSVHTRKYRNILEIHCDEK